MEHIGYYILPMTIHGAEMYYKKNLLLLLGSRFAKDFEVFRFFFVQETFIYLAFISNTQWEGFFGQFQTNNCL